MKEHNSPIAVDLDGSLILTDMLLETFVSAIFRKPWIVFFILPWIFRGKSYLKYQLAVHSDVDVTVLPYNTELLEFLEGCTSRPKILCTATNSILATRISDHLGIFFEVMASTKEYNLVGSVKAQKLCERFGEKGFSYVGNEHRDLKIWSRANSAIVVGGAGLVAKTEKICSIERVISPPKLTFSVMAKALRLHQWVKNVLLFIPLAAAHQFAELGLLIDCLIAFVSFGMCASATYIVNDLADLNSDRVHRKKRFRPLASGQLGIDTAVFASFLMLASALALAFYVNVLFLGVLCSYILITLAYSFILKRLQTVDIIVLAALYTVRIVAGAAAVGVQPSFWLLAFSMFIFLSLALVKRISEIIKTLDECKKSKKLSGRGYYTSDIDILKSLAASSSMVSILVFAMYINSDDVTVMYSYPQMLWMVCPILAYWLIRLLIMNSRAEVDEDPVVFALKDKRSWLAGAVVAVVFFIAL